MTEIINLVLTFEDRKLVQTSIDASPCMLQQAISRLCQELEDVSRDNALEAKEIQEATKHK